MSELSLTGENLDKSVIADGTATPSQVVTDLGSKDNQQGKKRAAGTNAKKTSSDSSPATESQANGKPVSVKDAVKKSNVSNKSHSNKSKSGSILAAGKRYKGRVRLSKGTTIIAMTHTSALMVAIDRGAKLPDGKVVRYQVVCIQPYGDKYPLRVSNRVNILPNDLVLLARGHTASFYVVNTGVNISKQAKRAIQPVEFAVLHDGVWVSGVNDNNQPCYKVLVEVDSANFSPSLIAEYDASGQAVLWLTDVTIRILE